MIKPEELRVFIDTNVFIDAIKKHDSFSAQIWRLVKRDLFIPYISTRSTDEASNVAIALHISLQTLTTYLSECEVVTLNLTPQQLRQHYDRFVKKRNDAHIAAGAKKARANVLLTSNIRDFRSEVILADYGCQVLRPEEFLKLLLRRPAH